MVEGNNLGLCVTELRSRDTYCDVLIRIVTQIRWRNVTRNTRDTIHGIRNTEISPHLLEWEREKVLSSSSLFPILQLKLNRAPRIYLIHETETGQSEQSRLLPEPENWSLNWANMASGQDLWMKSLIVIIELHSMGPGSPILPKRINFLVDVLAMVFVFVLVNTCMCLCKYLCSCLFSVGECILHKFVFVSWLDCVFYYFVFWIYVCKITKIELLAQI